MSHHVLIRHPCEVVAPCPENDGNKSGIDQRENALICTLPPRVVDITKSFGPRPTCEGGTERAEYFNIHVQSRNDLNCVKTLGCPVPCQLRKLAVCHSVTDTLPPHIAHPHKPRPPRGCGGGSFCVSHQRAGTCKHRGFRGCTRLKLSNSTQNVRPKTVRTLGWCMNPGVPLFTAPVAGHSPLQTVRGNMGDGWRYVITQSFAQTDRDINMAVQRNQIRHFVPLDDRLMSDEAVASSSATTFVISVGSIAPVMSPTSVERSESFACNSVTRRPRRMTKIRLASSKTVGRSCDTITTRCPFEASRLMSIPTRWRCATPSAAVGSSKRMTPRPRCSSRDADLTIATAWRCPPESISTVLRIVGNSTPSKSRSASRPSRLIARRSIRPILPPMPFRGISRPRNMLLPTSSVLTRARSW